MPRRGLNRGRGGGGRGVKVSNFASFAPGGVVQPFGEQSDNRRTRQTGSGTFPMGSSRKGATAENDEAVGARPPPTARSLRQFRRAAYISAAVPTSRSEITPPSELPIRERPPIDKSRSRKRKHVHGIDSRTKRAHRALSDPSPDAQISRQPRYEQQMADAPAKCLLSEERFRRLGGMIADRYVERGVDGSYCVHPDQTLFDTQIAEAHGVDELSDDQIRYLFYRVENELRGLAARGQSRRHRLFMADRNDILNFAMPFNEYTDRQRTLIRNLCQDHLRIKSGFNDFYIMQVLIPEACIRIHMQVHGTTFEESDDALDLGMVNLREAVDNLDAASSQSAQTKMTLTSILGTNEDKRKQLAAAK